MPGADNVKSKSPWKALIAVTIFLTLIVIYGKANPSDWVDVTIGPLPKDTRDFCLIAEDSRGVGTMHWYHSMFFADTFDPSMNGVLGGGFWDFDNDGFITASVQWREARRYGVLIQRQDDQWRLYWLEPGEMSIDGSKAAMHLPANARAQVPSKQFLARLGFSQ